MEGRSISEIARRRAEPNIAADLDDQVVSVEELHPHPENPRRGDVGAIAESLARFGQVKPVLALPDGTIIAGHHVYYAARHLGWDRIAVVRADLSPSDARAYLLADNRISELGGYDPEALGTLLSEVQSFGGLEGTGYRDEDVKRFLADVEGAGRAPGEIGGGGSREREAARCPMCGTPVADS